MFASINLTQRKNKSEDEDMAPSKLSRMAWEKLYLETLIDHLRPVGNVLEVGFALGYAANRIQTFHPKHHTIIEPDPVIAEKAMQWIQKLSSSLHQPSISVINESWEKALPELGNFNAIFYDDIRPEFEVARTEVLEVGNLALQQGRKLVASVKAQFPELIHTCYADGDLDQLFLEVGDGQKAKMAKFLHELLYNGQISKGQYEKALEKYRLERVEYRPPTVAQPRQDPVLVFLQACLKNHMSKGSRFSWSAGSPNSKFESPEFFDGIITNCHVDYEEKLIPIDVPISCNYYPYKEALIGVVEKQT